MKNLVGRAALALIGGLVACGSVKASGTDASIGGSADAAGQVDAAADVDAANSEADAGTLDASTRLLASGDPSASVDSNGGIDVAFVGNDGDIHLLSFSSTWTETDLTSVSGAPKPAGGVYSYADATGPDRYVVYVAADGSIQLLAFQSGGWDDVPVAALASAPAAAGTPTGLVLPAGGTVTQVIEYRG